MELEQVFARERRAWLALLYILGFIVLLSILLLTIKITAILQADRPAPNWHEFACKNHLERCEPRQTR